MTLTWELLLHPGIPAGAKILLALGSGTRTIREWITGGRLTAYNFGSGPARPVYRVLASDLAAFVAARRVQPQDEADGAGSGA